MGSQKAGRGAPRRLRSAWKKVPGRDPHARRHHPVHDEHPHPRKSKVLRIHRRRPDAQAHAGLRRNTTTTESATTERRVPQAYRERRCPGASLPSRSRSMVSASMSDGRGDPEGTVRPPRGSPPGEYGRALRFRRVAELADHQRTDVDSSGISAIDLVDARPVRDRASAAAPAPLELRETMRRR